MLFRQLPGVITIEPFRHAFVRIRFGHQRRQLGIQGLPANGLHNRVLDEDSRQMQLPPGRHGDFRQAGRGARRAASGTMLLVEFLEGKRPSRLVPLAGLAEDFAGIAAYMDIHALNRFMGEGDIVTGANFRIDQAHRDDFCRALKGIPRVSWVAIKESLRENFRQTTAASIGLIQMIYMAVRDRGGVWGRL